MNMKTQPGSVRDNSGSISVHVTPDIERTTQGDELIRIGGVQLKLETALEIGAVEQNEAGDIVVSEYEAPAPIERLSMPSENALMEYKSVLGSKAFDGALTHALAFGELDSNLASTLSRIDGADYAGFKSAVTAYTQDIDATVFEFAGQNGVNNITEFAEHAAGKKEMLRHAKMELAISGTTGGLSRLVEDFVYTKAHRNG